MSPSFPLKIVNNQSPSPAPAPSEDLRTPLHPLNGISPITNSSSNCNITNISIGASSDTSSASTDAPRGCLRFFLSHSSKTPPNRLNSSSKTPKSTPNVRPLKSIRSKASKENIPKRGVQENPRRGKTTSTKFQALKKNPPCLYKWQPGKKPSSFGRENSQILSSAAACSNSVHNLRSEENGHSLVRVGGDKSQPAELNSCSSDLSFTPLRTMEIASGSDRTVGKVEEENSQTSNGKTPPVEASISPEIQCGSSIVSKVTPICYGAGYVVSGVSDKRKCRPRGILIVGENNSCLSRVKAIDNLDSEEEEEEDEGIGTVRDFTDSVISKAPSPIEASMNWLLSPCNEEDEDHKEDSENAPHSAESLYGPISLQSLHSPPPADAPPPAISSRGHKKLVNNRERNSDLFTSSNQLPEFQGFSSSTCTTPNCMDVFLQEGIKQRYQTDVEISPFSMDSFGSENVIRTPQSDPGSAQKVCSPWLTAESSGKHDLNSVCELLSLTNLSSGSPNKAIMSSTDLNFQFDCLATVSNSMDVNQFQKILDDEAIWNSYSSCEDVVNSQMRVSWREGLVSRIYEMDEFDTCRCLSDEEEAIDSWGIDLSDTPQAPVEHSDQDHGVDPIVTNDSGSPKLVIDKAEAFAECEEIFCHQTQCSCSCAESISTDGGGLAASGDSDWNLCYKNQLFDF